VYSRGRPFSHLAWWIQLLSAVDGATVDAWPFFPGSKVGKTFISIFIFYYFLVALISNRDIVR
jgi:hypothetical protein